MRIQKLSFVIAAVLAAHANAADRGADAVEGVTVFGERVETTLSDVATTGSRLDITPLQTPASVELIDGELIRQRGDSTVVEAITRATGLSNDASPGDGGSAMSARGFVGHSSIMQLYDGVRLFVGAGTVTFPFDTWAAQRIEVLRGPASVMYGQGAIGGVINVVPRKARLGRYEGEVQVGGGADGRLNAALDVNVPVGSKFAYRLDASYREADNWVERGDSDSLSLSASALWQPVENVRIALATDVSDVTQMQYFGTPLRDGRIDESLRKLNYNIGDSSIAYDDSSTRLSVEWAVNQHLTVRNTAYALDSDRHWRNVEEYYLDAAANTVERLYYIEIYHHQEQIGNRFDLKASHDIGASRNTFVIGFDVNSVDFQHVNNAPYGGDSTVPVRGFDPGRFINVAGTFPKYDTDTSQYSLFFENRFELNERWSFIAGARYDDNDYERTNLVTRAKFGATFKETTWRVGAVFQPVETLSFYAQYATAVDPIGSLASLSATDATRKLTTGKQIEIGVKQQLFANHLEWTLALYDIVKENLVAPILETPDPDDVAQIGEQSSRGVEASLAYTITDRWRIDANVTLLDAEYEAFGDNTGNTPRSVPERLANLWMSWQFLEDWRARAGLRHVGKRYMDDSNTAVLPSYSILDAAVDWAVSDAVTVGAHVRNATDKVYAQSSYGGAQYILGMPRTWELQARYRF